MAVDPVQLVESVYQSLPIPQKMAIIESWCTQLGAELAQATQQELSIADAMQRLAAAFGAAQQPTSIQGATQSMHQEMVQQAQAR